MEILNNYKEKFFSYIQYAIEKNLYCNIKVDTRKAIHLLFDKNHKNILFEFGLDGENPFMEFWSDYGEPEKEGSFHKIDGWTDGVDYFLNECLTSPIQEVEDYVSIAWYLYNENYRYEFTNFSRPEFFIKQGKFCIKNGKIIFINLSKERTILTKKNFYKFIETEQ